MAAFSLDLPDKKLRRLEVLARVRGTSVAGLFEEMLSVMLAEADAETRFQLRVQRAAGKEVRGLNHLGKAANQGSSANDLPESR